MFRITQYLQALAEDKSLGPKRTPSGPVVIWNLIRRCNLACKHCYSISADHDFPGELSTQEIYTVMDDLKAFGVTVLILSGGEPLLRPDIYAISKRAKALGFYVGLSTNGTLIDADNIQKIAAVGYDYVGISIDGTRKTHDKFRRREGAFQASMNGIRLCQRHGIKVGLRFTLTQDNAHELPDMLRLMKALDIDKFYLSHLNYAGRGNRNRKDDVVHTMTRQAMDLLFEQSWKSIQAGQPREFVSGNNDADGVYLLKWLQQRFPDLTQEESLLMRARLAQWGGNASGLWIANIDNLGAVHPDTFWWDYSLGNVRERPFSKIWIDTADPLMARLKQQPRPVTGRCGECHYLDVCGGNTRVRAWSLTGDPWQEDPACYLTDEEIGASGQYERLKIIPYKRPIPIHPV